MSRYINVFYNPGFEGGLDFWTPAGWYAGNLVEAVTGGGLSGDCIRLTVPAELGQSSVKQTVSLAPGVHTVTLNAKRTSGNADVWIEVKVNGIVQYSPSFSSLLSSEYTELNYTFTVDGNEDQDVEIRFIAGSVAGVVYFDSVSLYIDDALPSDTPTPGVFTGLVYNAGLNLRASCNTSATRLTQIPKGTTITVEIVEGEPEWFATSYDGHDGFVVAQYVAITEGGGECTPNVENSLNVRKTTSTSATRLYSAYPGDSLRLLDYTSVDGWYRISCASGTGWAVSDYLTVLSYPALPEPEEPEDPIFPEDPEVPSVPTPSVILTDTMEQGDTGAQVTALQQRLAELWYYPGDIDGDFGYATEWAVRYFQTRNGLTVTGIVNANTRSKLNSTSAVRGVDDRFYNYHTGSAPQQWYMNGAEAPWRYEEFDADNTSSVETIADSGNCPTSFAMIASTLTHSAITPAHVCDFAKAAGYRDENGQNGVTSSFFAAAANKYGLSYHGTVSTIDDVIDQLAYNRLALVRIVGDTDHGYCSNSGATYLVIYSVGDGYVWVANPNYNTRSVTERTYTNWKTGGWMREAHIYSIDA